jgi:sterol desaturase/sphingolipid hydroxylase (fatty acid hydroxylase superfamily)
VSSVFQFLAHDLAGLRDALAVLLFMTAVFAVLGRIVKPKTWLADARAATGETRINLIILVVDQLTVTPLLAVVMAWAGASIREHGLQLETPRLWQAIGPAATVFLTLFVGDFVGYWRHRAQHSRWLWPAHAIHHSDTRLTWFSLERMHPIDRLGSAVDTIILGALGFPVWAITANVMVRHFYGYVIHADLPFTWGKASWILNSPAMHRWHHARDIEGSGSNFATVFSVFDRTFGTFHQPGPCHAPLGVREDMGRGAIGQYLYPLREWRATLRRRAEPVAADAVVAD